MPATALFPISPAWVVGPRPAGIPTGDSLRTALGLGSLRAPQRLLESTLHAMRSVTSESASSDGAHRAAETATSEADAAETAATTTGAGAAPAHDPDDPDAPRPKGPFDPGVVSMEELIREHSDAVYRVALSVTRDPILAEDVSQDALIKAWQALPSFRGDSPLRNWVLRITHNTAISTLRKRRDELREPDQLPERMVSGSVESAVQDRLALGRFEVALADLDELSRSIVVLREVEGLSYAELCDVLDLPMPTIKTRLLRARRQLAHALEGWQP